MAAAALTFAACGGPPAGYPDTSGVVAAQEVWCKALAKTQGAGDAWEPMASCKSAYPTASAVFLKGVAKCYADRVEAAGDTAPDGTQILADCTEEVIVKMPADEVGGREVIEARCQWASRCAKVPVDECKAGVAKLESSQRALMTTRFNAAALHKVSGCLESSSCSTESEEAAYNACYKEVEDDLFWSPR